MAVNLRNLRRLIYGFTIYILSDVRRQNEGRQIAEVWRIADSPVRERDSREKQ